MILSHRYKLAFFCPVGNCGTSSIQKTLLPYHDDPFIKNKYEPNFRHFLNDSSPFGLPSDYEGFVAKIEEQPQGLIVSKHISPYHFRQQASQLKFFNAQEVDSYVSVAVTRNPWDWVLAVFLKNCTTKECLYNEVLQLCRDPKCIKYSPSAEEVGRHRRQFFATENNFTEENVRKTLSYLHKAYKANAVEFPSWDSAREGFSQGISYKDADHYSLISHFIKFENLNESFNQVLERVGIPPIPLSHDQNNKNQSQKKYSKHYTEGARKLVEEAYASDCEEFNYSF